MAIVTGKVRPLNENAAWFRLAEETVTLAPEALRVPLWLAFCPTFTLPKFIADGDMVSSPAVSPVPESGTVKLGLVGLVARMLPLAAPADVGAKVTLNVKLCPAPRISGSLTPETENPEPPTFPIDTVWLMLPGLLIVSGKVKNPPT